jgi:hypothetical protein
MVNHVIACVKYSCTHRINLAQMTSPFAQNGRLCTVQ